MNNSGTPKIKLWLDDERDPVVWRPGETWQWIKTAEQAIDLIKEGNIAKISLDHDLGPEEAGTGYQVACAIEEMAFSGVLLRIEWSIHSANPVGRKNMERAMQRADYYWAHFEESQRS